MDTDKGTRISRMGTNSGRNPTQRRQDRRAAKEESRPFNRANSQLSTLNYQLPASRHEFHEWARMEPETSNRRQRRKRSRSDSLSPHSYQLSTINYQPSATPRSAFRVGSAGCQPAVSPIGNRPARRVANDSPVANRRYSRLPVGATPS